MHKGWGGGVLEGKRIFSHTLWMLLNRTGVKFSQSHSMCFNFPGNFLFLTVGLTLSSVQCHRLSVYRNYLQLMSYWQEDNARISQDPFRDLRSPSYYLPNCCGKSITCDLNGAGFKSHVYHWMGLGSYLTYLNLHFSSITGDKNLSYKVL